MPGLKLIGTAKERPRSYCLFLPGVHAHDIGTLVNDEGIAIRTGHHCTQPVMKHFRRPRYLRARRCLLQHNRRDRPSGRGLDQGEGGIPVTHDSRHRNSISRSSSSTTKARRISARSPGATHEAEGYNLLCGDHSHILSACPGTRRRDR